MALCDDALSLGDWELCPMNTTPLPQLLLLLLLHQS